MARVQGKRVSRRWKIVLGAAQRTGVRFRLNSGRRTMTEQWALFRENMVRKRLRWVPRPGRPLTAFPSPNAPHIRVGRQDHAVDVDMYAGDGVKALAIWLREQGVTPEFTVPAEGWHMELGGGELKRLARRLSRRMTVSRRGVALVAEFEGFRSQPYKDPVGIPTIGFGHTAGVTMGMKPWSRAKALRVLKKELNSDRYAGTVRRLDRNLTQPQFDALTSFVYNVGPGALAPTTGIGRALREYRWRDAADELLRWDFAGGKRLEGLTRRRKAERELFLEGI